MLVKSVRVHGRTQAKKLCWKPKGDTQMINLISKVQAFWIDRNGATAIEYGLIAGGIALAIVAAVFAFGGSLSDLFGTIKGKMDEAATKADGGGDAGDAGATE
jgi:pilus assembly protein Flp/PilA